MWYVITALLSVLITFVICNLFFTKKFKAEFIKGQKQGIDDFLSLLLQDGYNSRVNEFQISNKYCNHGGIVFVGDSITQAYNVYEYFSPALVYNRGIGGDTTEGLLKRLDVSIFNLKPKAVVLMIGTNDFALLDTSINLVYENIKNIIFKIKAYSPDVKIYLQSIYPISKENHKKISLMSVGNRSNEIIDQTNELLKTIEDVVYIDVNSYLKDENGNLKIDYTVEGLHINEIGYQLITEILKKHITN